MKTTEKLSILADLYIHGEIDKEDYIRLCKSVKPTTIKLHGIIRELREQNK